MISRIPVCVANLASLVLVKISPSGPFDKFAKPSNAGCVTPSSGVDDDCVCVATGECSNVRVVCIFKIRRPTITVTQCVLTTLQRIRDIPKNANRSLNPLRP